MEITSKIGQLLTGFPDWGQRKLSVNTTDGKPGTIGLFLTGMEEVDRQRDLMGNALIRNRNRYALRCWALATDASWANWMPALASWIRDQSVTGKMVQLGTVYQGQQVQVSGGNVVKVDGRMGTVVYEMQLTVDYMTYWEVPEYDQSV